MPLRVAGVGLHARSATPLRRVHLQSCLCLISFSTGVSHGNRIVFRRGIDGVFSGNDGLAGNAGKRLGHAGHHGHGISRGVASPCPRKAAVRGRSIAHGAAQPTRGEWRHWQPTGLRRAVVPTTAGRQGTTRPSGRTASTSLPRRMHGCRPARHQGIAGRAGGRPAPSGWRWPHGDLGPHGRCLRRARPARGHGSRPAGLAELTRSSGIAARPLRRRSGAASSTPQAPGPKPQVQATPAFGGHTAHAALLAVSAPAQSVSAAPASM